MIRHRQRGAVAIEAIILSSVLITVLGAGLFVHRAYATKFRTIRDARTAAWQPALRGCAKPPEPGGMANTATGVGEEGSGDSVTPETFTTWVAAGEHGQPRSEQVEGANGFASLTAGSKNQVTCNPITSEEEGIEAVADVVVRAARQGW